MSLMTFMGGPAGQERRERPDETQFRDAPRPQRQPHRSRRSISPMANPTLIWRGVTPVSVLVSKGMSRTRLHATASVTAHRSSGPLRWR